MSEAKESPTPVLFRKEGKGEIVAIFPTIPAKNHGYDMRCYAHLGQHSGCSVEYYQSTKPAKPEEYADLKRELEGIGYVLKVVQRRTAAHTAALKAAQSRVREAAKPRRGESEMTKEEWAGWVLAGLLGAFIAALLYGFIYAQRRLRIAYQDFLPRL